MLVRTALEQRHAVLARLRSVRTGTLNELEGKRSAVEQIMRAWHGGIRACDTEPPCRCACEVRLTCDDAFEVQLGKATLRCTVRHVRAPARRGGPLARLRHAGAGLLSAECLMELRCLIADAAPLRGPAAAHMLSDLARAVAQPLVVGTSAVLAERRSAGLAVPDTGSMAAAGLAALEAQFGEAWLVRDASGRERMHGELGRFVGDDLVLAATVLALGQAAGEAEISFIELGCGVGWMTHVLRMQTLVAAHGFGVDATASPCWALLDCGDPHAYAECRVELASDALLDLAHARLDGATDGAWLLAVHCDGLACLVPELARRLGPRTRFAVLPCCAVDETGTERHDMTDEAFVRYVAAAGEALGFAVSVVSVPLLMSERRSLVVGVRSEAEAMRRHGEGT